MTVEVKTFQGEGGFHVGISVVAGLQHVLTDRHFEELLEAVNRAVVEKLTAEVVEKFGQILARIDQQALAVAALPHAAAAVAAMAFPGAKK